MSCPYPAPLPFSPLPLSPTSPLALLVLALPCLKGKVAILVVRVFSWMRGKGGSGGGVVGEGVSFCLCLGAFLNIKDTPHPN